MLFISGFYWLIIKNYTLLNFKFQKVLLILILAAALDKTYTLFYFNISKVQINFEITNSIILIFIAGFLVGLGTRMSGGCTSGHGICGISRFSIRSIVATITFIASGVVTVFILQNF